MVAKIKEKLHRFNEFLDKVEAELVPVLFFLAIIGALSYWTLFSVNYVAGGFIADGYAAHWLIGPALVMIFPRKTFYFNLLVLIFYLFL